MNVNYFIAFMLILIFVALAWRFVFVVSMLFLAILMWILLFKFCQGVVYGLRESLRQ